MLGGTAQVTAAVPAAPSTAVRAGGNASTAVKAGGNAVDVALTGLDAAQGPGDAEGGSDDTDEADETEGTALAVPEIVVKAKGQVMRQVAEINSRPQPSFATHVAQAPPHDTRSGTTRRSPPRMPDLYTRIESLTS